MLTLLLSLAAQAACTDPVSARTLSATVDEAVLSYAAMDEEGFSSASARAQAQVPCLTEVVTPTVAASFHRMYGLDRFVQGDAEGAMAAFAAARTLDPQATLSKQVAPEGGPLAALWASANLQAATTKEALALPGGASAWVDGTSSASRPSAVPSVVQVGSGPTAITFSGIALPYTPFSIPAAGTSTAGPTSVGTMGPAPAPAPVAPAPAPAPVAKSGGGGGGGTSPFWYAAGASGVVAASLFGVAAVTNGSYEKEPTQGKHTLNQASYWGSVGTGGLTAVFLGIAIGGSL